MCGQAATGVENFYPQFSVLVAGNLPSAQTMTTALAGAVALSGGCRSTIKSAGRSPGNRGPSSFFSRRAHLLTTASAQTPYPSPRRKRQVSSIPLCLLFPQSQRLCGSPFAAVVCLAASCALRGGFRFLRKATDNATAFADAAVIVCAIGQIPSLQPTLFSNRLRKPATGSFAAEMDRRSARPFSLLRKRNRKKKTR